MDESTEQFAREIIKHFGEDRFYHSALWNGSREVAKKFFIALNSEANWDAKERELGLDRVSAKQISTEENMHVELCRIVFSICSRHKELGIKNKKPPHNIHARMVFSEKNKWVESYFKIMEDD